MSVYGGLNRRRHLNLNWRTRVGRAEKIAGEDGLPHFMMQATIFVRFKSVSCKFVRFKSDFVQTVRMHAIGSVAGGVVQAVDPRNSAVDHANEFFAEIWRAVFEQALLCFLGGKPRGLSIRFLRRFEARHFAKMDADGKLGLGRCRAGRCSGFFRCCSIRSSSVRSAPEIAGKWGRLHTAMNASLFKRFEGRGLGMREAGFGSAFGENPAPAAGLDEQEFQAAFADAVANGGDLLAFSSRLRPLRKLYGCIDTHGSRVRDAAGSG